MKLNDGEKLILIMLCEIHQKLKIENGVDTKLVQEAIYGGNLWGIKWAFTGIFHDFEPTDDMVHETVDILDMFSFVEKAYEKLSPGDKARVEKEAAPLGKHVKFTGFDGNGEVAYISIAGFLIERLDRFQEFKGRDLNSHMPSLEAHRRMVVVFEPLRTSLGDSDLTTDQIIKILNARIRPDHQKAHAN